MSELQNIEKVLADYEAANKALNEALKENGKKCIEELFTKIFSEHEGLNFVLIQGSTPSFNDGDVCTHDQSTFTGAAVPTEWRALGSSTPDFDYEYDDTYWEEFEYDEETGVHINSTCTTLKQAKQQIECFDEVIERVFDTNFLIKISRNEDNTVSVDVDDCDPGY